MSLTYFVVIFGILIAKSLGFFRDVFFADVFGATAEADIYFQMFGVVTLVFTGIGVALSTLMIKNLNKADNVGEENRRAYVSRFILRVSAFLFSVTAILYITARPLVMLLLPDIPEELMPLALKITYIMLPSLFFVVVAYIISGVLQNSRVFFISSVVSLPYNILIIAELFFGGADIIAVSVATTIGWGLHIVFQLSSFYRCGYRFIYKGADGARSSGVTAMRETACIFVSNLVFQMCFIIDRSLCSGSEGMITSVNYASNLFVTISSVFVVAMSSVLFPAVSKNYEEGKYEYVRRIVRSMILSMLVIFVPYLLTVTVFGGSIVSLLWERGNFTHDAAVTTSTAFVIYSFGVFGYIAEELFSKVLYLSSKYVHTVLGFVFVTAAKLLLGRAVTERFGAVGAAVTTTVLLTVYAVFISLQMKRVIGAYFTKKLAADAGRVIISGVFALAAYFIIAAAMPELIAGRVSFILPLLICGAVYAAALFATGLVRSLIHDVKNARTDPGAEQINT